ncbi:Uncharacterized protein Fot_38579 [Forsythia ovata]|uniref:Uncharacterized protein n=1 Tax=Forsythia ovata TaxID=205694 RepID=A0ABD1S2A6_9LAMI
MAEGHAVNKYRKPLIQRLEALELHWGLIFHGHRILLRGLDGFLLLLMHSLGGSGTLSSWPLLLWVCSDQFCREDEGFAGENRLDLVGIVYLRESMSNELCSWRRSHTLVEEFAMGSELESGDHQ